MQVNYFKCEPQFIQGSEGNLFGLLFRPDMPRSFAIILPPHGEEMNRCRRLVAQLGRILAKKQIACLAIDYYGTGDSDGDFNSSDWGQWLKDIDIVRNQFSEFAPLRFILVGIRLGCLLALDYMQIAPKNVLDGVLIQPVTSGKVYVNNLLRQRMAHLMANGLPKETTDQMRDRIMRGDNIESGGYNFGGKLLADIGRLHMEDMTKIQRTNIHWIENTSMPGKQVTVSSQKCVQKLQLQKNNIIVETFTDPPIWQLHDRAEMSDSLLKFEGLGVWK